MKIPFFPWRQFVAILAATATFLLITTTAVIHEHHIKVNFDSLHHLIGDSPNDQQQNSTEKIETDFLMQKIRQLKSEKEQLELSQSTMMLSMKSLQMQTDRMQKDYFALQEIMQSQQEEKDTTLSEDEGSWWQIITLVLSVISIVQYMMGISRAMALKVVKNDKTSLLTQNKALETRVNDLQDQLKVSHVNLTRALKDRDSLLNETTVMEDRLLELQDRIETDKSTLTKLRKEKERLYARIVILEHQSQTQIDAVIPPSQTNMTTNEAVMITQRCDIVNDAGQGNELMANESTNLDSINNHSYPSPPRLQSTNLDASLSPPSSSSSLGTDLAVVLLPTVVGAASASHSNGGTVKGRTSPFTEMMLNNKVAVDSDNNSSNGLAQKEVIGRFIDRVEGDHSGAETLSVGEMTEKEEMEEVRITTLTPLYRTPGSTSSSIRGKHTSTSMFSDNGSAASEDINSPVSYGVTQSSISLARSVNARRSTTNYHHRRSNNHHNSHHNNHNHNNNALTVAAALLSTPFSDTTLSDTGSVEGLGLGGPVQGTSAHGQGPGSTVMPRPRSRR